MKFAGLILLILIGTLSAVTIGPTDLSAIEAIQALFGKGNQTDIQIVREIRLPRAILAAIIGAGLGASGAALQGYTRNPLAAPGILGFSACASLGAVAALYFGLVKWVPAAALFGAGLGALLIILMVGPRKGASTLILAGVGIGALATAVTGLLMNLAPNPWALSEIVYWMMGSLKNADMSSVKTTALLTAIGVGFLLATGPDLKTLSLGELTARSLGVSLTRVQLLLIAGVALSVGSGVAVAGTIGFVGLFVPHIMRMVFNSDASHLIGLSALGGAGFLVFADMLTRLLSGPGTPLYLGILTSLIGVPFFLWLAIRGART